jgi:predicted aminopeptidase
MIASVKKSMKAARGPRVREGLSVVRRGLPAILVGIGLLLGGCASRGAGGDGLGYYWQSLRGQMHLLQASRPIDDWLQDENLAPALRERLLSARRMRAFAVERLGLPDNASYRRYADLQRPFAVWNVVAAPPDSLELHRWCFPVAGCVGYRGYFAEADAMAQARQLADQGLESGSYGVPAYSTLGYLNWLGGDPLLNTFIGWGEGEFAGLLFHELAHQVVYVAGDTAFNESFATTVERLGTPLWLATEAGPAARARWDAGQLRRAQWRALTGHTRQALQQLYQDPQQRGPAMAQAKAQIYQQFRSDYAALRAQWRSADAALLTTDAQRQLYDRNQARLDQWVADANNASFGALAAYDDWVPAFTALWKKAQTQAQTQAPAQAGGEAAQGWQRFYAEVEKLAALPALQRNTRLCGLMPADALLPPACAPDQAGASESADGSRPGN